MLQLSGSSDNQLLRVNKKANTPAADQELTVIGFGDTDETEGQRFPSVLQQVTVNAIPNQQCELSKGPNGRSYQGLVIDAQVCASDLGEDSCQGDSGGPLILKGNTPGEDSQIGIVSWGYGCAARSFPGVYARTSHQFKFIAAAVCTYSSSAPAYFDCANSSPPPPPAFSTPAPAPEQPIGFTARIQLDDYPYETGKR